MTSLFSLTNLPVEAHLELRKEVHGVFQKVQSGKVSDLKTARPYLAGNIKHEYYLETSKSIIESEVIKQIEIFEDDNPIYARTKKISNKSVYRGLYMHDMWVNFQRKHEFNPVHIHYGVYSFVIWINIPYKLEDEMENWTGSGDTLSRASLFSFITPSLDGGISDHPIMVDKSYEGKLLVFPANIAHTVYPFSTSDDYRISVAGNIYFK